MGMQKLASGTPSLSTSPEKNCFSDALRTIAKGLLIATGAASIAGCSPKTSSYWTGAFTKLPDPPAEARMQIGVSTEHDGTVFINYVTWNAENNNFVRKDIHYTTTTLHPGSFTQAGGYEQRILDGEVLASGAIVNQKNGKIFLPGGAILDGPSGTVQIPQGRFTAESPINR